MNTLRHSLHFPFRSKDMFQFVIVIICVELHINFTSDHHVKHAEDM